ncbi:hypothetical protein QUA20_31345, partial [Microcoleus sp. Pol7_A1]|uniref:hypothetical protein n=1 Tax=Microcoleus sp. Pol7_A1 TaxID=2818893 RepID=UPI002FD3AACE
PKIKKIRLNSILGGGLIVVVAKQNVAKESDMSSKWVLSVEQSISGQKKFKTHVNFNKTRRK